MVETNNSPKVWLVRLGRYGEQEPQALETGLLELGWEGLDLTCASNKNDIRDHLDKVYQDEKPRRLDHHAAQLNQFKNLITEGDVVVVPSKLGPYLHIGAAKGEFFTSESKRPARMVDWLKKELPRSVIKQDLLYSLGALSTVCQISRNNAAERFAHIISHGKDPGDSSLSKVAELREHDASGFEETEPDDNSVELEMIARDQIERHISTNFVGHEFTELVAHILRAEGYTARVSPPGPDQSVDIVAGSGRIGLNSPRIVVQVKSGDVVVDHGALQQLIGAIADKQADYGLLVSWSGFTQPVVRRTNELYFRVRLWDRSEILNALFGVYDKLPESLRAELPLKRTWTLVVEE